MVSRWLLFYATHQETTSVFGICAGVDYRSVIAPAAACNSTSEPKKTAAAIRLSHRYQETRDCTYSKTATIRPTETHPILHLFHVVWAGTHYNRSVEWSDYIVVHAADQRTRCGATLEDLNAEDHQRRLPESTGSHIRLRSPEPSGYIILCALLLRKLEYLFRFPELYELAKQKKRCIIRDAGSLLHIVRHYNDCVVAF